MDPSSSPYISHYSSFHYLFDSFIPREPSVRRAVAKVPSVNPRQPWFGVSKVTVVLGGLPNFTKSIGMEPPRWLTVDSGPE